ncbi:phosphoribosylglycinamide formyltransferase [Fodinisporobacter ferrooxydans]|uniref:Phosphoribosylglycinamide formyltransferase n=1 Tax=Fodinisporobacter ferrooxydans TaxID=2901836 RepID=A0ABY4CP13_9BACL|nr:phosphoribosylglycinamide formyltransferase [Alicyclobacillaceae bacterium MYW30-H2]
MQRIAVFASGTGSNFQCLLDAEASGMFRGSKAYGKIALLVTDKPACGAVAKAQAASIPVAAFSPQSFPAKAEYEQAILQVLKEKQIDWIVLAGYMRLIGSDILQAYSQRMINLHPSLLPAFSGKDAIGQAFQAGVKVTGVTVHFVDEGMDTGPILAQQPVTVLQEDTLESLTARIHGVEHELLPKVVASILQYRVVIEGRKVYLRKDESIG